MKRVLGLIIALVILVFALISCGGKTLPDEGIFYCEEINMSIDFSMVSKGIEESAKKYSPDGESFSYYKCNIDGNRITISSKNGAPYVSGEFRYNKDEFWVIEDGGNLELKFLLKE